MARARPSPAVAALAQATAGASSAVFTAVALHPLEVVKTRIQTGRSLPPVSRAIGDILKTEGICALYRGLAAQCFEEALENFVFFYLYDACLKAARAQWRISAGLNLAIGYVAGVGTTSFVLPVEILSTQLQLSQSGEGVVAVFKRLLHGEGLSSFFKGYWLNLILCANPAIQNTCFDRLRSALLRRGRRGALSPLEALLLGAFSKAMALSMCYPLVRMKVAIQAGQEANGSKENGHTENGHVENNCTENECTENENAENEYKDNGQTKDGLKESAIKEFGLKEHALKGDTVDPMHLLRRFVQLYRGLGTALTKSVVSAALLYMLKDQIARLVKAALLGPPSKGLRQRALAR